MRLGKAVDRATEIVNNRVNQYGVSEPTIQKQGGRRINRRIARCRKMKTRLRQLLQGTAMFRIQNVKGPANFL